MVFRLSLVLGLEDCHVPTFWHLLYGQTPNYMRHEVMTTSIEPGIPQCERSCVNRSPKGSKCPNAERSGPND